MLRRSTFTRLARLFALSLGVAAGGAIAASETPPPAAAAAPAPLAWPAVRAETKPWSRWWWFGNIADQRSLTTRLEQAAAAGLGGLEVTPIYGVHGYEDRFVSFLSPRWTELLRHTLVESHRLGLGIDLATGTGWPFGGPWLEPEDVAHTLAHRVYQVTPGERLQEPVRLNATAIVRVAGPRRVTLEELRDPVTANPNLQDLALDQVRFPKPMRLVSLMAFSAGPAQAASRASKEPAASAGSDMGGMPMPRGTGVPAVVAQDQAAHPSAARGTGVPPVSAPEPAERGGGAGHSAPAGSPSHEGSPLDLTSLVRADGSLDWTAPAAPGPWTLYALFEGPHGKMVERAAPGGEGFALDHFSSAALGHYLARFDAAFAERHLFGDLSAGGGAAEAPRLRAFFNDSYEVDDADGEANWTPRFLDEFAKRRGYDLRAHLPELFAGDDTRVLSDYRETLSDLLLDEFTRPWREWAHRHGALIRNQAHNSPANILDLYAASDIPEQEGNGFLAIKLASSAAHVTGKPLASAETATWLNEHFLTTLAQLKENTDEFLLAGINHVCYHGTAFSPLDAPWPGFNFYASVELNPANPFWDDFAAFNGYVTRAQSFLQLGQPDEDVLLYYNIHDRWAQRGDGRLPHLGHGGRDPVGVTAGATAAALHEAGVGFDYVSDRLLAGATVGPALPAGRAAGQVGDLGRSATSPRWLTDDSAAVQQQSHQAGPPPSPVIHLGGAAYRAIVVPATELMPEATFARLLDLASAGATILVQQHLPRSAPGWPGRQHSAAFARLLDRVRANSSTQAGIVTAAIGRGRVLIGDDLRALLDRCPTLRREKLRASGLEFVRRRADGDRVYFLVNRSERPIAGWVPFEFGGPSAVLFDPMTGDVGLAAVRPRSGRGSAGDPPAAVRDGARDARARSEVYLQLAPGESCFVRFHPAALTGPAWRYFQPAAAPHELTGPWSVAFVRGGPALPAATSIDALRSWTEFAGDAGRAFSGTAVYTRRLARPSGAASAWELDLGRVADSARVTLNGRLLATLVQPPWRVVVPAEAWRDDNTLEIAVTNLAANRIADLDRRDVPWKIFYNANFPARFRENVGPDHMFTAARWAPRNSGLLGPVKLTPLEKHDPTL